MIEIAVRIAEEITEVCPDILDFVSVQGPGRPRSGTTGEPLRQFIFFPEELNALYDARKAAAEESEAMFRAMGCDPEAAPAPVPAFLLKPEGD